MTAALKLTPHNGPTAEEIALEGRIRAELDAAMAAHQQGDRITAYAHLDAFRRLIAERSPRQIRRMEQERGLA